ncbi:MAG: N-acetylneuraminate synthase family protein [Alphaproteobacteria bacterium]
MSVFVIAEAGVNHLGNLGIALAMIDVAAEAGASACKFQAFKSENLVTGWAPKATYQSANDGAEGGQLDMLRPLELPRSAYPILRDACERSGIELIVTPFDIPSIPFLAHELGLRRLKIASGETTNSQMLVTAARTQREIILSTGMTDLHEVKEALGALAFGYLEPETKQPTRGDFLAMVDAPDVMEKLKSKVTLLHCTSQYPTPIEGANVMAIPTMREAFGLDVGLSDHTLGSAAAAAAAAHGARMFEKHFTLSSRLPGPDHLASAEPDGLKAYISMVRDVVSSLGDGEKRLLDIEKNTQDVARRSLVAARPISKGEVLTEENLTAKRPADGKNSMDYWDMLGKQAARDYDTDEMI